jgi:transposase
VKEGKERIAQQGEREAPPIVAKALAAIAKTARAEPRKLDAAIAARIKANPAFARRAEIIASVPGLADQAIAGVTAWFPELGHISNEAAAALIGAARLRRRQRRAQRRALEDGASCATFFICRSWGAAAQPNPVLKAYDLRLARKGQAKVAIIACMRKLIVILNTLLARDRTWSPPARAAA